MIAARLAWIALGLGLIWWLLSAPADQPETFPASSRLLIQAPAPAYAEFAAALTDSAMARLSLVPLN